MRSVNRTFKERPLDRSVLSQADDRPDRQVVDRTANNPVHRFSIMNNCLAGRRRLFPNPFIKNGIA
jgi:hypothetical protein